MKKINLHYVMIFSLLYLLIISCAANSKFQLSGKKYSPYQGEIQLLETLPESKAYEVIGNVSSMGRDMHSWDNLVESMMKKAAQYGANAIVITKQEMTEDDAVVIPTSMGLIINGDDSYKKTEAIAIRISDVDTQ